MLIAQAEKLVELVKLKQFKFEIKNRLDMPNLVEIKATMNCKNPITGESFDGSASVFMDYNVFNEANDAVLCLAMIDAATKLHKENLLAHFTVQGKHIFLAGLLDGHVSKPDSESSTKLTIAR